jgi:hypothetical protein
MTGILAWHEFPKEALSVILIPSFTGIFVLENERIAG